MYNIKFIKESDIDKELIKDWDEDQEKKKILEDQYKYFGNIKYPAILIIGPRGGGKTVLSLMLIRKALMTTLTKLYIFSSTIKDDIKGLNELYEKDLGGNIEIFTKTRTKTELNLIDKYRDAKSRWENLKKFDIKEVFPNAIFYLDDIDNIPREDLDIVSDMFVNGRHFGIVLIVCQHSYNELTTPLMRNNSDVLILMPGLEQDTIKKHIYKIISSDFNIDDATFKQIYLTATKRENDKIPNYLVINKKTRKMSKKFGVNIILDDHRD